MRCRKALEYVGPYVDGELTGAERLRLEEHLRSCRGCAMKAQELRDLKSRLSSMPVLEPTPRETSNLLRKLRAEMASEQTPRPAPRRTQLAAAASVLLIIVLAAGLTWGIMSGGEEPAVEEAVTVEENGFTKTYTEDLRGQLATAQEPGLMAVNTRPSLYISGEQYSADELREYRGDLGTRLDFYSTYWYPVKEEDTEPAELEALQDALLEDITAQTAEAGRDPAALELAFASAMGQEGCEDMLPCHAELALLDGSEVWLVSLSGPDDALLFKDPQIAPAMHLASRGGQGGLRVSEATLKELARELSPYYGDLVMPQSSSPGEEDKDQGPETPEGEEVSPTTPVDTPGQEGPQIEEQPDFQALLRKIASRWNSEDLLTFLRGLNEDQLLQFLQGNWDALAGESIHPTELVPIRRRLWAADAATGELVWNNY